MCDDMMFQTGVECYGCQNSSEAYHSQFLNFRTLSRSTATPGEKSDHRSLDRIASPQLGFSLPSRASPHRLILPSPIPPWRAITGRTALTTPAAFSAGMLTTVSDRLFRKSTPHLHSSPLSPCRAKQAGPGDVRHQDRPVLDGTSLVTQNRRMFSTAGVS